MLKKNVLYNSINFWFFYAFLKDFHQRFALDSLLLKKISRSCDIKEKSIKERSDQIIKGLPKKIVELRFDKNPKTFSPHENSILEKIISLQKYYHAREKIYSKSKSMHNKEKIIDEKSIISNGIECLENYQKLLESPLEREAFLENKSAYLVNFLFDLKTKYFF